LTTFGSNNIAITKSDYNLCEHGMSLKLSALRLGSNCLIVTKTKPVFAYGSSSQFLSIGLLSYNFIKHSSTPFLVAPIICFELRNKKPIKEITPQPYHFLDLIVKYI
jgi:hypothetical protein